MTDTFKIVANGITFDCADRWAIEDGSVETRKQDGEYADGMPRVVLLVQKRAKCTIRHTGSISEIQSLFHQIKGKKEVTLKVQTDSGSTADTLVGIYFGLPDSAGVVSAGEQTVVRELIDVTMKTFGYSRKAALELTFVSPVA